MNISTYRKFLAGGVAAALMVLSPGCAKDSTVDTSGMAKSYIEAWMNMNHPGVSPSGLGVYILEDTPGNGPAITDNDYYIFADYTVTDLDGNVSSTTYEKTAQQVGFYSNKNYYGSDILVMDRGYTKAGVIDMLGGMRVGGKRTALIPGWLNVNDDYDTAEEYQKKGAGNNAIYSITIVDKTDDIVSWQVDTLKRYVALHMSGVDSTKFGYYCKTLKEPTSQETFTGDTTFYINYTGRLLNGHVFDTTIADTAKVHGIYSSSREYAPMAVHPASESDYTSVTIATNATEEGTTVVDGFALCLSKLRPFEKVVCAFYSELGYGYSGSGSSIPKFAPISFEVEVVADPTE